MADITKCKDCKYYQRLADYHTDPRGLLYDACMCAPHWCAEIRITLSCPLESVMDNTVSAAVQKALKRRGDTDV